MLCCILVAMIDIQEGDEVRVYDVNGSRRGQPEGGWVGTVEKVGRTLAHIDYPGGHGAEQFRLSDGRRNDRYGHQYFRTLAQADEWDRRVSAASILRDRGVELSNRHSFTLEQIEALAEVVQAWRD